MGYPDRSMALMTFVLRALAITGGLVLCYGALFLYEREQAAIQNALEEWWIRIDDLQFHALRKHAAFLRGVSDLSDRALRRVFGPNIVSIRAIAISLLVSFASTVLIGNLAAELQALLIRAPFVSAAAQGWCVEYGLAMALVLGIYTPVVRALGVSAIVIVMVATVTRRADPLLYVFWLLSIPVTAWTLDLSLELLEWPILVLVIGSACNLLCIAALRMLVAWQANSWTAPRIWMAACLQLTLALFLSALPIWIGLQLIDVFYNLALAMILVPLATFLVATACTIVFVVAATLLLHRAVWPALQRPLYQIARAGVFRSAGARAALFALGSSIVAVGAGRGAPLGRMLTRFLLT